MDTYKAFLNHCAQAAARFQDIKPASVLLIHHNDADGLSSGAILTQAIERSGAKVRRYCLEKPYPEVMARLFDELEPEAIVIADFGSGMLGTLQTLDRQHAPIFVLDHHQIQEGSYSEIELVNCLAFDIPADPDCSASTIAALFSFAISNDNADLAALAIPGAVGDRLVDDQGKLSGLNKICAERAIERGEAYFDEGAYKLRSWPSRDVSKLVQEINSLGSAGYFRGGPDIAVKALLSGESELVVKRAMEFATELDTAYRKMTKRKFLSSEGSLQWFSLDSSFGVFGVKTVGLICERLIDENLVQEDKYLAGFQTIPDEIPGLGALPLNQVKVSMRLPKQLRAHVNSGSAPNLAKLLPQATHSVEGFVDACHPHAAATTIPRGRENDLIRALIEATAGLRL